MSTTFLFAADGMVGSCLCAQSEGLGSPPPFEETAQGKLRRRRWALAHRLPDQTFRKGGLAERRSFGNAHDTDRSVLGIYHHWRLAGAFPTEDSSVISPSQDSLSRCAILHICLARLNIKRRRTIHTATARNDKESLIRVLQQVRFHNDRFLLTRECRQYSARQTPRRGGSPTVRQKSSGEAR